MVSFGWQADVDTGHRGRNDRRQVRSVSRNHGRLWLCLAAFVATGQGVAAQVDQQRAAAYFADVTRLCEGEGGQLWGISLCGPIALIDAATKSMATSQPAPPIAAPAVFGFANSALDWGGTRWTTVVWGMIPENDVQARRRLLVHELFHRIQPQLRLQVNELQNPHLDTLDGRYWLQLEWRALADALRVREPMRTPALRDALGFRAKRHQVFPGSAEAERRAEINEGLAQYTGTVVAASSSDTATADAVAQLIRAASEPTFVRTFAYPAGAAYGLLLDAWSPGWTRQFTDEDDLAQRLALVVRIQPTVDVDTAAGRYDGAALRLTEEKRDVDQKSRVVELRRTFVDGPVLLMPRANNASFVTVGVTPLPGAGTIMPSYRVTAEWGTLEADRVLVSDDRTTIAVPAPMVVAGGIIEGKGWTLRLASGWILGDGPRQGDYSVVRKP